MKCLWLKCSEGQLKSKLFQGKIAWLLLLSILIIWILTSIYNFASVYVFLYMTSKHYQNYWSYSNISMNTYIFLVWFDFEIVHMTYLRPCNDIHVILSHSNYKQVKQSIHQISVLRSHLSTQKWISLFQTIGNCISFPKL